MRGLINAAVSRPISTLMVFVTLVLLGIVAASTLGMAALPEVHVPKMVVSTAYPGLPADEIRSLITQPLEDALSGVRGMKHVESVSREGVSTITMEFHWGTDLRLAGVELRETIDRVFSTLPADTQKPQVLPIDPGDDPLVIIAIKVKNGDRLMARRLADRELKSRLQQVRGAGMIVVVGGQAEEIRLLVDRQALYGHNTTIPELSRAIAAANYDYPAGMITEGEKQLMVKAVGAVTSPEALGELYVHPMATTSQVPQAFQVKNVARIETGASQQHSLFSVNGDEGIGLYVHRQAGISPIEAADNIMREITALRQSYEQDLDIQVVWDGSIFMRRGVQDLVCSGLLGVVIAFTVLVLFTRDPLSALIIMTAVPVSILVSLLFLKLAGRTINLMSMGGLALGIGMMVDNSVVILENLQKTISLAGRPKTVAEVVARTSELSLSNMGATMTSVIVFVPVMFLPGLIGAVFADLSIAVISAQLASFAVSITLVPVLFLILPQRWWVHKAGRPINAGFLGLVDGLFRRTMPVLIRKPGWMLVGLVMILGIGLLSLRLLPFEFMPMTDTGAIDVSVDLPFGTTVERTVALAADIERSLARLPGVVSVFCRAGGEDRDARYHADPSERESLLHVRLVLSQGNRPRASTIAAQIESLIHMVGIPVSVSLPANPISRLLDLGNGGSSVLVRAKNQLELKSRLTTIKTLFNQSVPAAHTTIFPDGLSPELRFVPDRMALAKYQADLMAVSEALRTGLDGVVGTAISHDGREIPVRLKMSAIPILAELGHYCLRSQQGSLLATNELGRFEETKVSQALYRVDRSDAGRVLIEDSSITESGTVSTVLDRLPDYASVPARDILHEQLLSFGLILLLILVLLYLFLAAQLQSFVLPLLLMVTIPLAFSGIFVALVIAGSSINFDALLGIIVLFGVVINNSIILYEVYETRMLTATASKSRVLILIMAGTRERIRPIVITVSISAISMLPLALDFSGTSTQGSMAVAVIGGLLVSSFLTIFIIPLIFLAWFGRRRFYA